MKLTLTPNNLQLKQTRIKSLLLEQLYFENTKSKNTILFLLLVIFMFLKIFKVYEQ